MKPIIAVTTDNGLKQYFKHLKTFCEIYGLKPNTVCRYKFPKYLKKHGLTIEKVDLN